MTQYVQEVQEQRTTSTRSTIRKHMITYVVGNQKGGIGKTTTATAIATILSKRGYNTLLIDADMQCNSTDTYQAVYEGEASIYDILFDDISIQEAIQHTKAGDIVPADPLLREAEMKLGSDISLIGRLRKKLKSLKGYQFIIIDTGPSLSNLLLACVLAADSIIVPVTTDRYALAGLSQLKETLDKVDESFDKKVPIEGLLLVKYNSRMNLSKEITDILETSASNFETKLFKTKIRESTKAREAQALRQSLISYAPNSTTAQDYYDFVEELIGE